MTTLSSFETVVGFSIQQFEHPFIFLDKRGKLLRANSAASQQFEYNQTTFESISIFFLFPTINILQWNEYLRQLATSPELVLEIDCMTQSEKEFTSSIKMSLIPIADQSYVFIQFLLETEVAQPKLIQQLNTHLENAIDWKTKLTSQTFNLVKEMVIWVQPDGQVYQANEAMVRKLGYSHEKMSKMFVWDFSYEFPSLKWPSHWEKVKKEKSIRLESLWKRKDGNPLAVDLSLHYVKLEGKEYINAIAHNIGKKMEREDLIKMTYQTLNNSSDLIIWSKQDGSILYFNEAIHKLLGYTEEEFKNIKGKELVHKYNSQKREDATATLAANKSLQGEVVLVKKNGPLVITELTASIFEFQGEMITCSIFRDITAKRAREDRLRELLLENQELRLELEGEVSYLQEEIQQENDFKDIVTISSKYKKILDLVKDVAPTDTTVLLMGETGTGKELLARALHAKSSRSEKPLIKVNCGALPENLIESELFGHEKGAFTGADRQKKGKFELAHNGTIFLDEIGEMTLSAQVKLLRVLQEGEISRLGGNAPIQINARVIAATNRDLKAMIKTKEFREDLYYRLDVFPITNLPLRERKEDIPALVEHFMRKYSSKRIKKVNTLPSRARKKLMAYDFPGNIRELENIIERAVILSRSRFLSLQHWDLPKNTETYQAQIKSFEEVQKDHIMEVLQLTNGRVSGEDGAANLLKMNGKTLDSKMRKFGIIRSNFSEKEA